MHDNGALPQIGSFILLCIGLTATSAQSVMYETDVVIPQELRQEEVHLLRGAYRWSGGRRRRSDPQREDRLFLRLPAFGKELYLQLQRDDSFLAEGFVTEERSEEGSVQHEPLFRVRRCFYTGSVINHTDSFASLDACGGLTGLVQTADDSLFIEPVGRTLDSFSGSEHRLIRQKHSSSDKSASPVDSQPKFCQTIQDKNKDKKFKGAEEARGRRNAIRLSREYTLETVVVADENMVQYHGAEAAQRFLLTVMNMVYNMFQHQSLGARLNIRVTKLLLLHTRPEKLKVGHHGEKALQSFCHWQHEEYGTRFLGNNHIPGSRDDPPPVDAAVLVTRTDFCVHKDEPCDTVGIAYLGGTCSPKRKCVLAEDNGLNLAFTIAHELGHNMGISHDDDHATCTGHSHIMSGEWVKGRNPSDLSWSTCSRDDLEKFLRSKASSCLLHTDPRNRFLIHLPAKLPGMHYSADEQCQILFGTNATFCTDMEHLMCAGLWCLVEGDASCKTKLDPPLDGTECGADKWCRAGECVSKTPIPQHVDGDWSSWGSWSMCSRSCGTGARFRQRKCDNPPPGPGGRYCQKASVEHKVCEGPPCSKGLPTFRDQQCLSHDRQATKKKNQMMTAVINDERPCALYCTPVGKDAPVLVADRVQDGTPCGPYESDLCVNGKCQKIGCDGIIGSSAKEDRCGVCNGDGKSCKIIKGDFNHSRGMALKDSSKRSINNDWKIELPGEFELAGTTVRYVRRGLWEKMSAKGPTKTPLHLMVLMFHDQTYGIHYEYTVALNQSQEKRSETGKEAEHMYLWTHSSWEDCTVHCGGGERRTVVSCMRILNKTMSQVNDSYCHIENRPAPQIRQCNTHHCQYRWVTGEWGQCSVTCGEGLQRRDVGCVYQLQNGTHIPTRDLYCLSSKPSVAQRCEGRDCLTVWEASEWSKCSSECGRGSRTRTVTCRNPQGLCDPASRPAEEETCEDHSKCYVWKTGEWSKCSSSCGRGLQSRVVQCMHKVTGRHGSDCPGVLKPPAYRQCHQGACNVKVNVNTITSPRLAALTYKCTGDQWAVYCRVIREKNLCQDMRWYQRCCQTCRDFYTNNMPTNSS
ncbi:A disintegrin and metalloproteinase with thrombospondin motifs 17 isoform X3 [Triplophysa rosa]|uniref:A disintegrin and metalloproteinase with thrombospondin motifs 17 isoform X3 n=1 Tax=Triplophysa rosa TaxID=992332 RepID=UPI002545FB68|nr:A disintegrin and metalloproteinase with thrombospondin motifs 17 isoform X3 [Triplophysa rosa]